MPCINTEGRGDISTGSAFGSGTVKSEDFWFFIQFALTLRLCLEGTFTRNKKKKCIFLVYLLVYSYFGLAEIRLHLKKTQILFGFLFNLH